jgi:hypothetical protein
MSSKSELQSELSKKNLLVRGYRVMLDRDLAVLYGVPTKSLNLAVRRNRIRFPFDFMFQLSRQEIENLRFQIETSSWGGHRYRPYVFTEQGVAMLSSVLNSKRAALINISIMRVFVKLREVLATHTELTTKLAELERRLQKHDSRFKSVGCQVRKLFNAIWAVMNDPNKSPKKIGFQL